jgi:glycosyltransferase involved in cell wall biosynthesis
MHKRYLADFSLALINRTGAYYICRDVLQGLPNFFTGTRYWRFTLSKQPDGIVRKLLGRAMLFEISRLRSSDILPRINNRGPQDSPTLFFDPLYVLRAQLEPRDIVLCHDVGPITHAALFEKTTTELYREAYQIVQRTKPGMVFVSEASREEFISFFGSDYRFLKVIPLYTRKGLTFGDEKRPAGVQEPFLLSVGAMEIRKKYHRVIPAFEEARLHERGYSYVFCGPRANNSETIENLARQTPGVQRFGYLPDAELRWLYRHAEGFVLPSLLEGFGVPGLEAAKYGLIPIVNRHGAQKEAVGEGAILVDANSIQSIAEGMILLVTMPEEERSGRVAMVKRHAEALSEERYLKRWSELLGAH